MFALGEHNVPWKQALLAGRFAAPTSAGILFTMLEAAGMKQSTPIGAPTRDQQVGDP